MRCPYVVLINEPGVYKTRNGKTVSVFEIAPGSSFPCRGHVLKLDATGRIRRKFSTWGLDGRHKGTPGSGFDVVSKGADDENRNN